MLRFMNRRRFVARLTNSSLALSSIPAVPLLFSQGCATRAPQAELLITDADGSLGRTGAPVHALASGVAGRNASDGSWCAQELGGPGHFPGFSLPVQPLPPTDERAAVFVLRMPPGGAGTRRFALGRNRETPPVVMEAKLDPATGQYRICESGKPVLQYNYRTVEPGRVLDAVAPDNRKYAVARSNYLHPLWGLNGEELTRDWSVDHPHHRGIYWAWPEVDWRGSRGDLHALQIVFARGTGHCKTLSGPIFAQIEAENVWEWQSGEPIVKERAIMRAWNATSQGRLIDLEFRFQAVQDPVLLARRGADKYGGLNLRFAPIRDQQIHEYVAPADASLRPSWADISGRFSNAAQPVGITILQHQTNPNYPGDWVKYPELDWLQPTFPKAGTRYPLRPTEFLTLRYRLWIHPGGTPANELAADQWAAANAATGPFGFPWRT